MIVEGRNIPSSHLWIFEGETHPSSSQTLGICEYEMPTIPASLLLQWLVQPSESIMQLMVGPYIYRQEDLHVWKI